MPLEIRIPMPALSMNNSHMVLKRGGRIKKKATRIYEDQFIDHLMVYADEISTFLKAFDPKKTALRADYEFYFPAEKFFTKRGTINCSYIPDTDNLVKITQDLLFSKLTNDAYIVEFSARKLPTRQEAYIKAFIEECPFPEVTE